MDQQQPPQYQQFSPTPEPSGTKDNTKKIIIIVAIVLVVLLALCACGCIGLWVINSAKTGGGYYGY
jgi:flagellar basal body-associated protein FliL